MGFKDWLKDAIGHDDSKPELLTPIATTSWIDVFFSFVMFPNDISSKTLNNNNKTLKELISIQTNIQEIIDIKNRKIIGYINPYLGINCIVAHGKTEFMQSLRFNRIFTYKISKSKEFKKGYRYLIRPKEGTKKEKEGKSRAEFIQKGEKVIYGYSPKDLIRDIYLLIELDHEISNYFKIPKNKDAGKSFIDFNEKNEPIGRMRGNCLCIEYKMKDRLKLVKEHPDIDETLFGDFDGFMNKKESAPGFIRFSKRWFKAVDKLREEIK